MPNLRTQLISILETLANNQLPTSIPDMENDWERWESHYNIHFQQECQQTHKMFGLVDLTWTKTLATELAGARVLEVMAGRGWLAKALSSHGIDIRATDGHVGYGVKDVPPVFPVKVMDIMEAIKTYASSSDVLICSWPPYDDPSFRLALRYWTKSKPIYVIGEGIGGCTADDKFWETFIEHNWYHHPNQYSQYSRVFKGYWPEGA